MYYPVYKSDVTSGDSHAFFTEAVFSDGKKTVEPLEDIVQNIKDKLDTEVNDQINTTKENKNNKEVKVKEFDPKAFWKDSLFKDLEDKIRDIFGFRNVEIHPAIEKYLPSKKKFETCTLNCFVYHVDRFPIEGLVTEKGFYDKSHSLTMEIYITLGLIQKLTADEILAVLLHEFGHSIDPALVDIKYTETNILSKYITDRKKDINKDETRVMKKFGGIFEIGLIPLIIIKLKYLLKGREGVIRERLNKIKKKLESDKTQFNRQNYGEAFADNFARMYGYGHILMRALNKMSDDMNRDLRSRIKKEEMRQRTITDITIAMIDDEHKTDIHRIHSLIKEYKKDIDDPNTPKVTKKQLQEDLTELEKVLDQYLNHKDEFQKRVNNLINDELNKIEEDGKSSNDSSDKDDSKEDEKK